MATRSFTFAAERKKVFVSDLRGQRVCVVEHGVDRVCFVELCHRHAEWLAEVLFQCKEERRVGLFRLKPIEEEELSVLVKESRGAIFASVQLEEELKPQSPRCVYLLAGAKGAVWESIAEAIRALRNSNRSPNPLPFHQPNVRVKSSSQSLIPANQDEKKCIQLEGDTVDVCGKVLVTVKVIYFDWNRTAVVLKDLGKLQNTPIIQVLEDKKAVVVCSCPDEGRRLLMVSSSKLLNARVWFIQFQDRNVILVMVKNCYIKKVPHVLLVSDGDKITPARIQVILTEKVSEEGVTFDPLDNGENFFLLTSVDLDSVNSETMKHNNSANLTMSGLLSVATETRRKDKGKQPCNSSTGSRDGDCSYVQIPGSKSQVRMHMDSMHFAVNRRDPLTPLHSAYLETAVRSKSKMPILLDNNLSAGVKSHPTSAPPFIIGFASEKSNPHFSTMVGGEANRAHDVHKRNPVISLERTDTNRDIEVERLQLGLSCVGSQDGVKETSSGTAGSFLGTAGSKSEGSHRPSSLQKLLVFRRKKLRQKEFGQTQYQRDILIQDIEEGTQTCSGQIQKDQTEVEVLRDWRPQRVQSNLGMISGKL